MSHITLHATTKPAEQKAKAVRQAGGLPGNITIPHHDSEAIVLQPREVTKLISLGQETALVYVSIEGHKTPVPVLIEEIQADAMSGQILHVAFKKVSLKEKVKAEIPLEFVGEVEIPNGVMIKVKESVEVEALPTDLPESIEVNLASLTEIGQSILLKDLQIDATKIQLVAGEADLESPVVLIQEHKEEKIEEPVVEPAEGEAGATEAGTTETASPEAS